MGLDQDKKLKIRESMDYEMNGRLVAVANKAAALNAPILIIGLGGTGVDSVIKVKKMIYERLECESSPREVKDKPANIEYLVIDTDSANRDKATGGIRFNDTLDECFIFTTTGLQEKIKGNTLPGYIDRWIDKNISVTEVINGAGGFRQVGRFMLFDNLREVQEAIESKIRRVTAPFDNRVPLYVFILAGVSGGTGSGIFIDIPYIVKGVARKIDDNRVVNRIGLIFLPDVNLSQPGLTTTKKENIKKNGFAALKELDYLMNVSRTGDLFEQDYGMFKVGKNTDGDIPPYEVCMLMSAKDQTGKTVLNPYEYTMNVAAETVVNFIAAEPNVDVGHFSINSFLSNEVDEVGTFTKLLGDDKRAVNYRYAVAGASSARLPLNDIMSYMTYLAFKEVDGLWNKIPKERDVYDALESFGIEQKMLEMQLCNGAPVIQNLSMHTYDLIKQAPQRITDDFNATLEKRKRYIDDKMDEMLQAMGSQIADENNYITEMFKDINYGPVFAQRLIFTTSDNLCITKVLKELGRFFNTNGPAANQIEGMKKLYENKLNDLLSARPVFQGSKTKLRDEFVKACSDYYDALYKAYCYDALESMCVQYHNMFIEKNNEVYDCVADLLTTLVNLFNKYAGIRTEKTETEEGENKTLYWSLISTPLFIRELESRMNRNDDLYVDLHAFITEFYSYLFTNVDIWNGREKADVVEKINNYISNSFQVVLSKSMDYYIDFIAKSRGIPANEFSQEIYTKLSSRSSIKFPTRATYTTTVEHPGYSFVSVPVNAGTMMNTIKAKVSTKSIIKASGIMDSIFMMNFKSAMPLSAYLDIKECHQTYMNLSIGSTGLHLYEGKKTNWRNLPSPYPQSEWETGYFIQREAEENERWSALFEKAKEYGFIKLERSEDGQLLFNCYWGELIDWHNIADVLGINPDKDGNNPSDAIACLEKINEKLNAPDRLSYKKALYESRMITLDDDTKVVDENFAKSIFIKMVALREAISNMVDNHEKCVDIVKKLEPYRKRKYLYVKFIKLFYTETVFKQRGRYVFYDKSNALQEFCSLDGVKNNYPDYYLYDHFCRKQIDGEKLFTDEIMTVCDKRYVEQQKTDEAFNAMRSRLQAFVDQLKESIDELNSDWQEVEEGDRILSTSKELLKNAEAELKGMQ